VAFIATHLFLKTTAVVSENDRSGFGKRPQSFWKTTAVVSIFMPAAFRKKVNFVLFNVNFFWVP